jgi:diguanylate cyclase (GGDEF)-like protein
MTPNPALAARAMPAPARALVSAKEGADAALQAWRTLLEALDDAAWIVCADNLQVVAVNTRVQPLLGLAPDVALAGRADGLICTPEDLAAWEDVRAGRTVRLASETVAIAGNGALLNLQRRISPLNNPPTHYLVVAQDLTDAHRQAHEREELLAELQATLESTADGILVTDLCGRIRAFNQRLAALWDMPLDLLNARQDAEVMAWMHQRTQAPEQFAQRMAALADSSLGQATERVTLKSGLVLEMNSRPQCSRGQPIGRVWAFRDLTALVNADRRIEALASTDVLTGLPNRSQLNKLLVSACAQGGEFALLLLDLDRFKQVNDSLGHQVGNRVLLEVTERLRGVLRQGDQVARLGGDQFALLVHDAPRRGAEAAARRLLETVQTAYTLEGMQFTLTGSIGVALHPEDGTDPDLLVRSAETAMQAAKQAGRACYRFHQARRTDDLLPRIRLDHAMRQALVSHRFRLHYQPQVDLATGRVVGAEALIRWRDPELGEVSPGQFIPVAEDTGFIIAIGDWVLAQAVRQAAHWRASGVEMAVAVNVSALQFQQADFVDRVAAVLAAEGLPGHLLELELTESILVRDADEALQRLQALAKLGVHLSIDDFGTGYSSLAYLKRFPIERLKIDRSFVRGLPADDSDKGIVRAIVQMARALNLEVVAEGVETEPQRQFLLEAGCNSFQGFLFAPALDAASFEVRARATPPASNADRLNDSGPADPGQRVA